jgi:hypothetical protein
MLAGESAIVSVTSVANPPRDPRRNSLRSLQEIWRSHRSAGGINRKKR